MKKYILSFIKDALRLGKVIFQLNHLQIEPRGGLDCIIVFDCKIDIKGFRLLDDRNRLFNSVDSIGVLYVIRAFGSR